MRKILDKITRKNKYEVWYFSDKLGEKDKILTKCLYFGNKIKPIFPEDLDEKLRKKFKF
jgi:hypothetical protein